MVSGPLALAKGSHCGAPQDAPMLAYALMRDYTFERLMCPPLRRHTVRGWSFRGWSRHCHDWSRTKHRLVCERSRLVATSRKPTCGWCRDSVATTFLAIFDHYRRRCDRVHQILNPATHFRPLNIKTPRKTDFWDDGWSATLSRHCRKPTRKMFWLVCERSRPPANQPKVGPRHCRDTVATNLVMTNHIRYAKPE